MREGARALPRQGIDRAENGVTMWPGSGAGTDPPTAECPAASGGCCSIRLGSKERRAGVAAPTRPDLRSCCVNNRVCQSPKAKTVTVMNLRGEFYNRVNQASHQSSRLHGQPRRKGAVPAPVRNSNGPPPGLGPAWASQRSKPAQGFIDISRKASSGAFRFGR